MSTGPGSIAFAIPVRTRRLRAFLALLAAAPFAGSVRAATEPPAAATAALGPPAALTTGGHYTQVHLTVEHPDPSVIGWLIYSLSARWARR